MCKRPQTDMLLHESVKAQYAFSIFLIRGILPFTALIAFCGVLHRYASRDNRSVVAALPSTTPRPVHKSSTDDLGASTLLDGCPGKASTLQAQAQVPESGTEAEAYPTPHKKEAQQ
jgi:hypothetical protein